MTHSAAMYNVIRLSWSTPEENLARIRSQTHSIKNLFTLI